MGSTTRWLAIGWTAAVLGACGCPCDAGAEARELAGAGAIDCGFVPLGDDPASALECAEGAIAGGGAFHVGFERQGRDSEVRTYLAGSSDETIWILGYDGGLDGACPTLVASRCGDTPSRTTGIAGEVLLTCPSTREAARVLCER